VLAGSINLSSGAGNANVFASADAVAVSIRTSGAQPYYANVSMGTCTLTGNYAAGPTGAYAGQATRMLIPTGQFPTLEAAGGWLSGLANTTYTFSVYVVSTTGADTHVSDLYSFVANSGGGNYLATTAWNTLFANINTWQRIVLTYTLDASANHAQPRFCNISGGSFSHDLLFWGAKLEQAATATGTPSALAPGQP
jgi:hypothetical protein